MRVSEWATQHRKLSAAESKLIGDWRNDRTPLLVEPMDCMSTRSRAREVVCMFPIQFGKALALDTPVPTPGGWLTMGELRAGDWVFDERGQPTRVVFASEVFMDHPCYRVRFSDGAEIVADAGHRWTVDNERHCHLRERVTLTTEEIAGTFRHGRQYSYAIPVTAPLQLPECTLPIDPYVLGVWLGDGASVTGMISMHRNDAEEVAAYLREVGHHCIVKQGKGERKRGSQVMTLHIDPRGAATPTFHARLSALGVLKNKHIPTIYLRASEAQRRALLQGLMDTDGHIVPGKAALEITSSRPALARGIEELLLSLGHKPVTTMRATSGRPSARMTFTAYVDQAPFRLRRKANVVPGREGRRVSETTRRRIVGVDPVPSVPTRCIAVESPSHLFLAGRNMVPTHNTMVASNALGYTMTEAPCPIMVCLPAEASMVKWVAQKLNPMLDSCPSIKRVMNSSKSRDAANTRTFKEFAGDGQLYIEHAGTPSRLKSASIKVLIVDELDEFASNLTSGDDPVEMLDGRTSSFPGVYKRLYISTPTIAGLSRIADKWEESDQRRYHVPCPHCGHYQPLEWKGLMWTKDLTECWYTCRECGAVIEEHEKTRMFAAGRWVPDNPSSPIRGYHANCLYYSFDLGLRWLELARRWIKAQRDPARLKTFINDRLAEPWGDRKTKQLRDEGLTDRVELYRLRTAPAGVLAITAGVDTQDDRLAVQIVGWGRGGVCWVLDYVELQGDPAEADVWAKLVDLLNRPITHAGGGLLSVEATAIDAGGHRTNHVYHFVRQKRIRRPLAIFGARANNAPVLSKPKLVDVDYKGQLDKRGVRKYEVGTVGIKDTLFQRLAGDGEREAAQRMVHLSEDLGDDYLNGLISETFNPKTNRYDKVRGGGRNEPLDTWVYAYAATHHHDVRLHRHGSADWDLREKRLIDSVKVEQLDSRETSRPPANDAPPASLPVAAAEDSRGTSMIVPGPRPPPMAVRSAIDRIVSKVEREPAAAPTPIELEEWQQADGGTPEERAILAALLVQLAAGGVPMRDALDHLLVQRARDLLFVAPATHRAPVRRFKRGMRNPGVR